ncbi:hypothetical protein NLI96_g9721 [Meripilus lineatus]|uniref:Mtf2-like C-terminal domain-containing protein n=1 Tax=Meripilus lineatus TaxID=2056292 RepID=A0AAD5V060_9APHY|nr:hypothetical protein NLI96_g9721 [Physisporinus lineatus]
MFSIDESGWDKVFEDIKSAPIATQRQSRFQRPLPNQKSRRQSMTMREISVFDEMFDLLFSAVSEHKAPRDDRFTPRNLVSSTKGNMKFGIGKSHSPLSASSRTDDLFGRLRSQSRKLKWTSEEDEELDRKKEEMDLCDTDQQLLEWAMREVFDESKRYEEVAREAATNPGATTMGATMQLQPPAYPHLLALLMKTFRDKYRDPYLALSMFEHARQLSIASFVFGCTTPAYNELIQTRWECFRDLRGVCDALDEMRVNAVEIDYRTRALAETIRREVGARNLWEEETSGSNGEVWNMVSFIEKITIKRNSGREVSDPVGKKVKKWGPSDEEWRTKALSNDDNWVFGKWEGQETETAQHSLHPSLQ